MEAYQNAALSPEERAKDLLGKMTLQEKVGQLNQRLGLASCTACTVPIRGQIKMRRPALCWNFPQKPII